MIRFVAVAKAQKRKRPPKPKTDSVGDYEVLHRIADELAPRFSQRVTETLENFRSVIDVRDVLRALAYEDADHVEGIIPWQDLMDKDDFLRYDIEEAVRRAGIASMSELKDVLRRTQPVPAAQASFDRTSISIEQYARERSGDLIREITDVTRDAVRGIISNVLSQSQGFETGAKAIYDAVGLTRSQAATTERFRNSLIEQGYPDSMVDSRTEAFRTRQLKNRAETIARTETIRSSNQGQLETWDQAMGKGLIDADSARKLWIVTPDDRICDICAEMDGVSVPYDESFQTDDGEIDAPPLHPNCRCSVGLIFSKDEGDEE